MAQSFTSENLNTIFTYPFKDPHWQRKLLIAWLVTIANAIIPFIPAIFLVGYYWRIMKRVISGDGELALPEWDDAGDLFVQGLKLTVANCIYFIPTFIFVFVGVFIPIAFNTTLTILEANKSGTPPSSIWLLLVTLGSFAGFTLLGLGIIISLLTGLVIPAAQCHLVAKGQFAAAFRVREWWPIYMNNIGGFILSLLVVMGIGLVVGILMQLLYFTVILCCLVPVLLSLFSGYIGFVTYALFAQAYREGVKKLSGSLSPQAL